MRIIILRPSHPYRGGIAAFDERLAQELICGGNEVELWTLRLQNPSFLFPGKTQFSTGPAPEGLTVRPVVHSINPFNWISVGMKLRKAEAFTEGIMEEKKKYSWEGMCGAVNDLYEKICCLKKENC